MGSDPQTAEHSEAASEVKVPPVRRKASSAKLDRIRESTEREIDEFMKKVGYSNPADRTDDHGWRWFEFGSARGRAAVVESESDGNLYLRAESMVMELPTDNEQLVPLMRDLLEANMTIAGSARLGVSGEGVFVCATIPVVELAGEGVAKHIHAVMAIAESFGEPLAADMGSESAVESSAPVD